MQRKVRATSLICIYAVAIAYAPAWPNLWAQEGRQPNSSLRQQEVVFQSELIFPLDDQHNHAPGIVQRENGDLLVSWYRGSGERTADDVSVMGAVKSAQTETWSVPEVWFDEPGFPDCNTCLHLDTSGELWLFWPTIIANSWESCLTRYRVAGSFDDTGQPVWDRQGLVLLKPDDFERQAVEEIDRFVRRFSESSGGKLPAAISEEIEVAKTRLSDPLYQRLGWQPRCKPTVLPSGRILLPLYTDTFSASIMAISDDGGANWWAGKPIIGLGNIQPSVLQREDGTLVAFMRENGVTGQVRVAESKDDGVSWSQVYSSELKNPGSGLDAVRLENGWWVLAYNDTDDDRNRLAVVMSDDEGRTWRWKRYLENRPQGAFHYPAIIQGTDGLIHVVYSYFVDGGKSMKHAVFSPAWIQQAEK